MSTSKQTGSDYKDIETIRDPDGITAVISAREDRTQCAVAFFKEYEQHGETKKTSFMHRRHLDAVIRLAEIVKEKMDEHNDRLAQAQRMSRGGRR